MLLLLLLCLSVIKPRVWLARCDRENIGSQRAGLWPSTVWNTPLRPPPVLIDCIDEAVQRGDVARVLATAVALRSIVCFVFGTRSMSIREHNKCEQARLRASRMGCVRLGGRARSPLLLHASHPIASQSQQQQQSMFVKRVSRSVGRSVGRWLLYFYLISGPHHTALSPSPSPPQSPPSIPPVF